MVLAFIISSDITRYTYNMFSSGLIVSFSNASFLTNARLSFVICLSVDPGILNIALFIEGNNLSF